MSLRVAWLKRRQASSRNIAMSNEAFIKAMELGEGMSISTFRALVAEGAGAATWRFFKVISYAVAEWDLVSVFPAYDLGVSLPSTIRGLSERGLFGVGFCGVLHGLALGVEHVVERRPAHFLILRGSQLSKFFIVVVPVGPLVHHSKEEGHVFHHGSALCWMLLCVHMHVGHESSDPVSTTQFLLALWFFLHHHRLPFLVFGPRVGSSQSFWVH